MRLSGGLVALLVAVFLVGSALGFAGGVFTMARRGARSVFDGPVGRQLVMRRLERQLQLRPDQVKAIREIMDRRHGDLLEERDGAQRKLKATRDSIQVEIERVLDDSQKARYRELVNEPRGHRGRGGFRHRSG